MTQSAIWPTLKSYSHDSLRKIALPLGGIGTGTVSLGGKGDLKDWEIMNRPAKGFQPQYSFFSIRVRSATGSPIAKILEGPIDTSEYEGAYGSRANHHGLPRFKECTFEAAYPFGQVNLSDENFPVSVKIKAFNPLIPTDAQNSSLEQSYAEERFAARQYELRNIRGDAESLAEADRNDALNARFSALGPDMAKGFRNMSAGFLNDPSAQKFNRDMGLFNEAYRTGVKDIPTLMTAVSKDASRNITQQSGQALLGNYGKIHLDFAEQVKASNLGQAEALSESEKRAEQDRENQKRGADATVAAQVGIRTNQRNQTQTTDLLTNKGLVPVTNSMAALSGALTEATDIVGQLAGKSKNTNVGGNKSAPSSAPSASSATPSATPSAAPGGGAGRLSTRSATRCRTRTQRTSETRWTSPTPLPRR
jgi:hypothetical protein